MLKRYLSRVTSSARGELFNFLIWPYLFSTFMYGLGFSVIIPLTKFSGDSSLYAAMVMVGGTETPIVWGIVAVATILFGLTFLMFNIPPFGRISGIIGFMLWLFASICYLLSGSYLVMFAVAVPNMVFWIYQYISLSRYRREDLQDKRTLDRYGYERRKGRS